MLLATDHANLPNYITQFDSGIQAWVNQSGSKPGSLNVMILPPLMVKVFDTIALYMSAFRYNYICPWSVYHFNVNIGTAFNTEILPPVTNFRILPPLSMVRGALSN